MNRRIWIGTRRHARNGITTDVSYLGLLHANLLRRFSRCMVVHPEPTICPGLYLSSDNPEKEIKDLTWAPEADERIVSISSIICRTGRLLQRKQRS